MSETSADLSSRQPTASVTPKQPAAATEAEQRAERRAHIEAKQEWVAQWLRERDCERLLVLEPANVAWLSGLSVADILDPDTEPGVWFSAADRWLVCSNVDSQWFFDRELSGMGFRLKEWSWEQGRGGMLRLLCQDKKTACDRPLSECIAVGDALRLARRRLSVYECGRYRSLGHGLSHALEATCRSITPEMTEQEAAAQLCHRLARRGMMPLAIGVHNQDNGQRYRRPGCSAQPVGAVCQLTATARKYGLCATASRMVSFGPPPDQVRHDFDAACRVTATYIASTWPDSVPERIFQAGQRVYQVTKHEFEWRLSPPGFVTGWAPVELPLLPHTEELLQNDWALTWQARVGVAVSCDTFLITANGPKLLTPTEHWPLKRIRIQGATMIRPSILQR
ncbi:MAG: M24 family metallopeptidase [Gemmataceae bacterium]